MGERSESSLRAAADDAAAAAALLSAPGGPWRAALGEAGVAAGWAASLLGPVLGGTLARLSGAARLHHAAALAQLATLSATGEAEARELAEAAAAGLAGVGTAAARYDRGVVLLRLGRSAEAVGELEEAVSASLGCLGPAWAVLGAALAVEGRPGEGLAACEAGLGMCGEEDRPLLLLALARLRLVGRDTEGAGEALGALLALAQRLQRAEGEEGSGGAGGAAGPAAASPQPSRAPARAQRLAYARDLELHAWAELSGAHLMAGDVDAAREAADRAAGLDPSSAAALFALGQVTERAGDLHAAFSLYLTGLQRDPESSACAVGAGAVAAAMGDDGTAERLLAAGLRHGAASARGYAALAHTLRRLGRERESEAAARRARDLQLTPPPLDFSLAPLAFQSPAPRVYGGAPP